MKPVGWIIPWLLLGCVPLHSIAVGQETDLLVYPKFTKATQAVLSPNTLASIATLDIVPYLEVTAGSYSPISALTGNATTLGAADMLKLTQASPSIDPNRPFILRHLKPNQNYRIYGQAFDASNAQISKDNTSFVDVAVSQNDSPTMATLPISLADKPFGATTSVFVNTSGNFDYLKATLYLVSGNSQVAIAQTTQNNPTFNLGSLQANTDYQLITEAYKLGTQAATNSLLLHIGNDNAPATASLNLTIPYLMSTIAGNGQASYQDGVGTNASFIGVHGITVDLQGNVYVADGNTRIRKILPNGTVSTFAGNGSAGYVDGVGTNASFNAWCVSVDPNGYFFLPDYGNKRIRKITPAGAFSTIAGSGVSGTADGNGAAASFSNVWGIAEDTAGNLYVADYGNNLVRKVDTSNNVTTIGTSVTYNLPRGIAASKQGNVYVVDYASSRIIKITAGGAASFFAGNGGTGYSDGTGTSAAFRYPNGITVDDQENLFVTDSGNNRIRKITSGGIVTTIAGDGGTNSIDGIATQVGIHSPMGISVDSQGTLFFTDNYSRVRKLR